MNEAQTEKKHKLQNNRVPIKGLAVSHMSWSRSWSWKSEERERAAQNTPTCLVLPVLFGYISLTIWSDLCICHKSDLYSEINDLEVYLKNKIKKIMLLKIYERKILQN